MRLHVVTGCRELLKPDILAPDAIAGLIGSNVRVANAYWLARNFGDSYHDFLQDERGDRRTAVMAEAINDGFGTRFEPLVVLPEMLGEDGQDDHTDKRSQYSVVTEMLSSGYFDQLRLYGLALPAAADPEGAWAASALILTPDVAEEIERLRAKLAEHMPPDSVASQVIEASPDLNDFYILYNNALSSQFARHLMPRLQEAGLEPRSDALTGAMSSIVSEWNERGVFVSLPLSRARFDNLADLLYGNLLQT